MKKIKTPVSAKTDQDLIGELFEHHIDEISDYLLGDCDPTPNAEAIVELDKRWCDGDFARELKEEHLAMMDFKECEDQFFARGR